MNKMMRITAGAALLLGTPGLASAATVADGSFESHSVNGSYEYSPSDTGVTFNNHTGIAGNGNLGFANAPDGTQFAFLQNSDSVGSIVFALSDLTVGDHYTVSFYLARRSGFPVDPLQVRLNGTLLQNSANAQSLFLAPSGNAWTPFTTSAFLAGAATASLSFTGTAELGGDFDVGLDAVRLTDLDTPTVSAVPEPASWAMMIGGFGVVGGALRRRRAPAFA